MISEGRIEARHKELLRAGPEGLKKMWSEDSLTITDYAFLFPYLIDMLDMLKTAMPADVRAAIGRTEDEYNTILHTMLSLGK